ncbi:hypothetical protein BFP72_11390 [Reichenbachiella sp. 5M10]|uniref:metallophosphoesterase family protein n=1 Tax=Reichenbachiella sp. 5M10 TaxID=1889772 RepID=UPI000C154F3B|nr:metallophosphoesterase [Reichenbachiella sp. 5M10]PIB35954.1 hypothetical protein BFP72_11390 [Reichenbachiella sp. 5M10]
MMNRLVVTFAILFAWGCSSPQVSFLPTYREAAFSSLAANQELDSLMNLRLTSVDIGDTWQLVTTDTTGGMQPDLPTFDPSQYTPLPHRILLPNTAIWYRREVSLDSGVLHVRADDGAQLWVDGQRVFRLEGEYFPFHPSNPSPQITIRVLNNAMHGGLRSVQWISQADWAGHVESRQKNQQYWLARRKKELARVPIDEGMTLPILLTDPIVQQVGDTLYLRWVSERGGEARFHWGEDTTRRFQTQMVRSESGVFLARVPCQISRFYYQIEQDNAISQRYAFQQKPVSDTLQFAVWGDSQGGWRTFRKLLGLMDEHLPSFGVGAGDLVSHGSDRLGYLQFLQALSGSSFVHYPVPGNHDYDGYYDDLHPQNYLDLAALPGEKQYFSWQVGNCAFIALDPDERFPVGIPDGSDQYDWFIEQIESSEWQAAEWRFVLLHHPPLSQGWPGYHGEESMLQLLEPHFESAKIDFVIAGHSHDYERLIRTYGRQQTGILVVGGGGGGIEPSGLSDWPVMDTVIKAHHYGIMTVEESSLTFKAYDIENTVIDSIKFIHP